MEPSSTRRRLLLWLNRNDQKLRPLDRRLRRAAHFAILSSTGEKGLATRIDDDLSLKDARRADDRAVAVGLLRPIEGRLDSVGREAAGATLTGAVLAFKVRDILSK
jgi:hypothetical protein